MSKLSDAIDDLIGEGKQLIERAHGAHKAGDAEVFIGSLLEAVRRFDRAERLVPKIHGEFFRESIEANIMLQYQTVVRVLIGALARPEHGGFVGSDPLSQILSKDPVEVTVDEVEGKTTVRTIPAADNEG